MTLAARCPQCSTVFRIVPDQLKISEGLVRCGQCKHVFNAHKHQIVPLQLDPEPQTPTAPSTFKKSLFPDSSGAEKQTQSTNLEDANFLDSLFSEFQIGWSDTVIDPEAEDSPLSQTASQTKNKTTYDDSKDDTPDEFIELDDTEFTASLMRLDDSGYDVSELITVGDEEEPEDTFASQFFADSLTKNLSFGSDDTILKAETQPETQSKPQPKPTGKPTSAVPKTFETKPLTTHKNTEEKTRLKRDIGLIIPPELSLAESHPATPENPAQTSNPALFKPIVIPSVTPLSDRVDSILAQGTLSPAGQYPDTRAPSTPGDSKYLHEIDTQRPSRFSDTQNTSGQTTQSPRESELSASHLSKYGNDSLIATTRLNEKYEKLTNSLQDHQIAGLSFIKQNQSIWTTPLAKLVCSVLSVALFITFIAQTILYRNYIVSYAPSTRPALVMLAKPFGLSVDYPISFQLHKDITTDFPTLSSMPDGTYQLEIILHNRASYAVAVPYIELNLQNVSGEIFARKILSPAELGIDTPVIAPQKELTIRRTIMANTQGAANVGYFIDMLYL